MSFGEICKLAGEGVVVLSIVECAGRKALCVSLEAVDLLNLAAIWEADILDTEESLWIVPVRRELAWGW